MPIIVLEVLAKLGVMAIEFVQKHWHGEKKEIVIRSMYETPCTVDCRKRGLSED